MSSKFKFLSIALVSVLALGLFVTPALADVTGSFGTHISIRPQSTASEISLIDFDIENDLNVTFTVSGLSSSFHTHFGIAGIEDVQLRSSAVLGALDLQTLLVYGRFGFGAIIPFYDDLHFIKKAVTATLSLGGVTFQNTAIFEDTNAFVIQTPGYAFGDVLSVTGQTPSGITIMAAVGLCAQKIPNSIKKHFALLPYSVNPDCATDPKPDILFDFEMMTISGVPLGSGVTGSSTLNCITITACVLNSTVAFSGGPIPFSTSFTFTDLLSLTFGGASIDLVSGSGSLSIGITPAGTIGAVGVSVNATINPDTNPATLVIDADIAPGVGLTNATVSFSVVRSGLVLGATAVFTGGPPAQFAQLVFSASLPGPPLSLSVVTIFSPSGLLLGEIFLTVSF